MYIYIYVSKIWCDIWSCIWYPMWRSSAKRGGDGDDFSMILVMLHRWWLVCHTMVLWDWTWYWTFVIWYAINMFYLCSTKTPPPQIVLPRWSIFILSNREKILLSVCNLLDIKELWSNNHIYEHILLSDGWQLQINFTKQNKQNA